MRRILVLWLLAATLLFARGGGGCFLPGTLVQTGMGEMRIESVHVGDSLLSFDGTDMLSSNVSEIYQVQRDYYYSIETSSGSVNVTAEHPFYIGDARYIEAQDLRKGDTVYNLEGGRLVPEHILSIKRISSPTIAYNLRVDGTHTFFANDFAVHNKGCFLPGTMVGTPSGPKTIESLTNGDSVIAFSGDTLVTANILDVYKVERDYYYLVSTEAGSVKATAEHPFYVGDGEYIDTKDLNVGDTLFMEEGGRLAPEKVTGIIRIDSPTVAYNLHVDGPNTFFANGFAVHNKGGCFQEGTEVMCPAGDTAIEDISAGDTVYSFFHGSLTESSVMRAYAFSADGYYEITAGDRQVNVTAEHPFYTGHGFVEAQDIHTGDYIYIADGPVLALAQVTDKVLVQEPLTVHNLETDGTHTFFANGFAVHNKGGCFLPGTLVSTPEGAIPIEQVATGQTVDTFSGDSISTAKVIDIIQVQRDQYYIVSTAAGSVKATAEHPFYVGNDGYRETKDLKAGDLIYALKNGILSPQTITGIEIVDEPTVAYNLHVDGPNTFFANGFAVHNKGGGGSSGPPDNLFYYSCSDLAANKSDCCAPLTSTYMAFPSLASTNLSLYAPSGFGNTLNCKCLRGGVWEKTSSVNSSYSQCACINQASLDVEKVKKCFDWVSICPLVFIIIFIIVISVFGNRKGSGFVSSDEWSSTIAVPKDKVMAKAKKISALLSIWGKVDPLWKEERIKADAKATFLKLQECWIKRDYTEMKPLMQGDLYMQHVAQLEAMKGRHEINRMDYLQLLDLQLVQVSNMHDSSKDSFVAWMRACAKDTIVDDRTMEKIRGDDDAGIFEEFWTFQRDNDSWKLKKIDQPEEGMDVIVKENFDSISTQFGLEQQYQKAGGPKIKDLGIVATRERDEGAVGSGVETIKSKASRVDRLLNFLAESDKIWDHEKMVGFTRSMFIAFNVALELKSLDQIKDNLSPEAVDQYQKLVDDLKAKGRKIEKRNLAVRNVEIILVKNYYDNRKDEFTAWVSGQAQTVITDEKTGKVIEGDGHVADFEEYWTFRRDGDQWKLASIESGFKKYVEEENVDEGSDQQLMQWYYTKDRAV